MRVVRYVVPIGVLTVAGIIVGSGLMGTGGVRQLFSGRLGAVPLSVVGALIGIQILWFVFLLSDR